MRILVDENIPAMTVTALRTQGHDVLDIRGSDQEGVPDSEVWNIAQAERRLLITTDKWFSVKWNMSHSGILIVLLKHPNRQRIHQRILLAMERFNETDWPGLVVSIRDTVLSIRRTP